MVAVGATLAAVWSMRSAPSTEPDASAERTEPVEQPTRTTARKADPVKRAAHAAQAPRPNLPRRPVVVQTADVAAEDEAEEPAAEPVAPEPIDSEQWEADMDDLLAAAEDCDFPPESPLSNEAPDRNLIAVLQVQFEQYQEEPSTGSRQTITALSAPLSILLEHQGCL